MIYARHRQAMHMLQRSFGHLPEVLACIVIGSIARGEAGADSDLDFVLVVTPAEYARRNQAGERSIRFPADDASGHAVPFPYLEAAAARGSEPTRFAFTNARVLFSHVPALAAVVAAIPTYPEAERDEKMRSFVSQLPIHFAYLQFAEYSDNPYVLAETAVKLVLFGGRLILAYNRLLYPGRKQFLQQLARAGQTPDRFMQLAEALVRTPGIATARPFLDAVLAFQEWPMPEEGAMARYQADIEQTWFYGKPPLEES